MRFAMINGRDQNVVAAFIRLKVSTTITMRQGGYQTAEGLCVAELADKLRPETPLFRWIGDGARSVQTSAPDRHANTSGGPPNVPSDGSYLVAVEVLEQHHDVGAVRALLGHARLATTQIRMNIGPARLKGAVGFCLSRSSRFSHFPTRSSRISRCSPRPLRKWPVAAAGKGARKQRLPEPADERADLLTAHQPQFTIAAVQASSREWFQPWFLRLSESSAV